MVCAWPLAPVVGVAVPRLPPPAVTANVTVVPAMGCPVESFTCTTRAEARAWPTVPVCASPETLATVAAACATVTATLSAAAPEVAVTRAVPPPTAVATPLVSPTVTTAALVVAHVTLAPVIGLLRWSFTTAVNRWVRPTALSVSTPGVMTIEVATLGASLLLQVTSSSGIASATSTRRVGRVTASMGAPRQWEW